MAYILPRDLTAVPSGTVNPSAALIVDNLDGVFKATPANVVDSGAPINSQAEAEAGVINTGRMTPLRVAQAISALAVSFATLAASTGAALVGFIQSGTGAVARTLQAKGRDVVSVKDFGAVGDGVANDTVAIQAAIDTNATQIYFPAGTYVHGNLSCNNDYQRFVGHGARLVRNANSTTITVSARGNQFHGIRFSGGSFTGNNITVTGQETEFYGCNSIETPGRAIIFSNDGGGGLVFGGVWNTTDATGSGYDIELFDTTPGTSLYTKIIGISTQQATGGILINGQGAVRVTDCQIGKLTISAGGGFFTGNRVIGVTSIQSSINLFNNNSFAANVTFGDGSGGAITQVTFGPTNVAQAGITLTINSEVADSSFHLGQLTGVTLVLNAPANDLWHGEIAYTPTLVGTGSPSLGNGTLTGKVSRQGRQWTATAELVVGSTTTLGTTFGISAPHKAATTVQGIANLTDSGTGSYKGVAQISSGSSQINVLAGSEPISGNLTSTSPFTWAANDILRVTITGQYAP